MTETHEEQVSLKLQVPDGYEVTGEYRAALSSETYMRVDSTMPCVARNDFHRSHMFILRRVLPDTLTVENLPRSWVVPRSRGVITALSVEDLDAVNAACLAALEAEGQS